MIELVKFRDGKYGIRYTARFLFWKRFEYFDFLNYCWEETGPTGVIRYCKAPFDDAEKIFIHMMDVGKRISIPEERKKLKEEKVIRAI